MFMNNQKMGPQRHSNSNSNSTTRASSSESIDPILHVMKVVPYSILTPPRLKLKVPTLTLPNPTTILTLLLISYFLIISGVVYDVIVEPPGIGSVQDPHTGAVKPLVFLPGRVNGQYIIEGLSSGFMFILGGLGIVLMDLSLAVDRNRDQNLRVSYAAAGVSSLAIAYLMTMLFIRIKIPGYLG